MGTIAAALLMFNPLYSASSASGDGRRSLRSVHAFVAGGLALDVGAHLVRRDRALAALVLPWFAGMPGRHVAACASSTASSGSPSSRPACAAHLAAARLSIARKLAITGATIVTVAVSLLVAVAFNPFLTAKPARTACETLSPEHSVSKSVWERFLFQVDFRLDVSKHQKTNFPNDALVSIPATRPR